MWSPIIALVALAGFALSQSDDPYCEIQTFLEPLNRWKHPSGDYHYTLGPTDKQKIFNKGRTYQFDGKLQMVIPEEVYSENEEKITSFCGLMEIIEIYADLKIATSLSQEAHCGNHGHLYRKFDSKSKNVFYYAYLSAADPSDITVSWVWPDPSSESDRCLKKEEVKTTPTPSTPPTTTTTLPTTTTTKPVDPYLLPGSPLCTIQSFLAPLYQWYDAATGKTKYTAKRYRNPNKIAESPVERLKPSELPLGIESVDDGVTYEAQRYMGMVIPWRLYQDNQDNITAVCGPMELVEMPNGPKVVMFKERAPCGSSMQLVDVNGSYVEKSSKDLKKGDRVVGRVYRLQKASKCPIVPIVADEIPATTTPIPTTTTPCVTVMPTTTTTPVITTTTKITTPTPVPTSPPLNEKDILSMTTTLLRWWSGGFGKHVYHTDANYIKQFYTTVAGSFGSEPPLGKVIPYKTYAAKKEEILKACPKLVVYKNVFAPTKGNDVTGFDQAFYRQTVAISDPLLDYGSLFVAATEKGHCGAHTPVYLIDSNRPTIQDWFYTERENEYNQVIKENTWYNRAGNGKGIQFYIW